jgi:hypothetical protein
VRPGRRAVVGWSVERERGGGDGGGERGGSGFKDKRREEERTVTQGERDTEIGGVVVSHGRPAENGPGRRAGVGPVHTRSPCLFVKCNGNGREMLTY